MGNAGARTMAQLTQAIAERCGIAAADVERVLEAHSEVVLEELADGGPGAVRIAGLVKAEVLPLSARGEHLGRNPATGEPMVIAARPARERGRFRLRPLKRLRDVL